MNKNIELHYNKAVDTALAEIEKIVRDILRKHKNLNYFTMCMGTYFFVDKKGEIISTTNEIMKKDYSYSWEHSKKYFEPLTNIFIDWDNELKLTGFPMKFTAEGEIITDW